MTIITPLRQRIFVRFARKPIWMPTAPSKLFRIAEHKFYSKEEAEDIYNLSIAYRAQELSIQEFMKHEFYIPATNLGGLPSEFVQKEMDIDRRLREENDRENARIAESKNEFLNNRSKELEMRMLEEKKLREEKLETIAKKVDEYILAQTPDSFITPDNIDSKIEHAIDNPVCFEFFIDPRGKRYYAKQGQPKLGQIVNEITGRVSN